MIKCSDCGSNVDILAMGDHVCGKSPTGTIARPPMMLMLPAHRYIANTISSPACTSSQVGISETNIGS